MRGRAGLFGFDEISTADRRLFQALGAREAPLNTEPAFVRNVARAVCHDANDELTQAAVWARQKLEACAGVAPVSLGIVVPDLRSIATVAERIFDDILHSAWGFNGSRPAFAISAGTPLAEAHMIAAALLTLRLIDEVPREEASMLWRSPFLGIEPGEGALLDVELRRKKVEYASLHVDSVKRRFPEMAARRLDITRHDSSAAVDFPFRLQRERFIVRALSLVERLQGDLRIRQSQEAFSSRLGQLD